MSNRNILKVVEAGFFLSHGLKFWPFCFRRVNYCQNRRVFFHVMPGCKLSILQLNKCSSSMRKCSAKLTDW